MQRVKLLGDNLRRRELGSRVSISVKAPEYVCTVVYHMRFSTPILNQTSKSPRRYRISSSILLSCLSQCQIKGDCGLGVCLAPLCCMPVVLSAYSSSPMLSFMVSSFTDDIWRTGRNVGAWAWSNRSASFLSLLPFVVEIHRHTSRWCVVIICEKG